MTRRALVIDRRARFAESAEALSGLADLPFRAARRLDNNPATLAGLAAQAMSLRDRIRRSADWMSDRHPTLADLYSRSIEVVEGHVSPGLEEAWKPSEDWGPARTEGGAFDTPRHVRDVVRLWSRARRWHRWPDPIVRVGATGPWSSVGRLAAKLDR